MPLNEEFSKAHFYKNKMPPEIAKQENKKFIGFSWFLLFSMSVFPQNKCVIKICEQNHLHSKNMTMLKDIFNLYGTKSAEKYLSMIAVYSEYYKIYKKKSIIQRSSDLVKHKKNHNNPASWI